MLYQSIKNRRDPVLTETLKATFKNILKPRLQLTMENISTNSPILFTKFGGKSPMERIKKKGSLETIWYEFGENPVTVKLVNRKFM